METIEKITAPDIIITIYPRDNSAPPMAPGPGPAMETPTAAAAAQQAKNTVHVDLNPYFADICCFELIAVQSTDNTKQNGVFIAEGKTGFSYVPDVKNNYWTHEDDFDVIEYCVRDIGSNETALGAVTLQVIAKGAFDALDICANFGKENLVSEQLLPLVTDLALVNKFENVEVIEIGDFDQKLISSIMINPDKGSELSIWLNPQCNNWQPGKQTGVEYAISALVDGDYSVSKAKLLLRYVDELFFAKFIKVYVTDPLSSLVINVRDYNPYFAFIELQSTGTTPAERGSISVLSSQLLRYDFNTGSGYWNGNNIIDTFRYTLYNSTTGKTACSYVQIIKTQSGSGSGSGSGAGGGTMLDIDNSSGNYFYLTNLIAVASYFEADLTSILSVNIKSIPGMHTINSGRVKIEVVGGAAASITYKFTFIPGMPPTLDSIAPILEMKLYATGTMITPGITIWVANINDKNPLNTSEDSYLEIA